MEPIGGLQRGIQTLQRHISDDPRLPEAEEEQLTLDAWILRTEAALNTARQQLRSGHILEAHRSLVRAGLLVLFYLAARHRVEERLAA